MFRILHIDDDWSTLLLSCRELQAEGYEVISTTSGQEGLKHYRSCRPDLVLLDARLPGMDGLELMSRMIAIDRKVPIVLFSAHAYYQDNFLSWAADGFVLKSSDLSELKRCIRNCIVKARGEKSMLHSDLAELLKSGLKFAPELA